MSRLLKTALWTLALLSGVTLCTVVASAQMPPIYVLMCPLGHDAYTPRGDTIIVLCGHAYGERATAAQSADRCGVNAECPCHIDQSFAISEALECLLALVLV